MGGRAGLLPLARLSDLRSPACPTSAHRLSDLPSPPHRHRPRNRQRQQRQAGEDQP